MKTATTTTTDRVRKALDILEERHGPIPPDQDGTPDHVTEPTRYRLRRFQIGVLEGHSFRVSSGAVSVQGSEWVRG